MAQAPLNAATLQQPSKVIGYPQADAVGNTRINGGGTQSVLNVSAAAVVKATPGRLCKVSVTTAGAAGAVYDHATTSGVAAANQIAVIPATVGVYTFDWPCLVGIVYAPGSAQVASISFD